MIGILGGTFDPIHNGHLYIAEAVAKQYSLQKILLIPCHQSPLRPATIASNHDRAMMAELAAKTNPLFELSTVELDRPAPSYMIDTLTVLKQKYPDEQFALILGADAYANFEQWRDWQEIAELAQLIVVNRNIMPPPLEDRRPRGTPRGSSACNPLFLNIPPCTISATDIRARIAHGESITGMVPKSVADYIGKEQLYELSPLP